MIVASWAAVAVARQRAARLLGLARPPTQPGSRNYVGIKDPAIDALIERVIFAKSRAELVAATKALDRVLLWHHYVVPQWTYGKVRTARWDRFGQPDPLPKYGMAGVSHRLVVGCGEGREDGNALVNALTRRNVLTIAAGAAGARLRALRFRPSPQTAQAVRRRPRERTACPPSATSNIPPTSSISTTSNPDAPKGGVFSQVGSTPAVQPELPDLQFAEQLHPSRAMPRMGMERTFASLMAGAADEPDSMYGLAARAVRISR